MARGGRRTGSPGTAYSNRTDLQKPAGKLPIQTPPSAEYGQSAALRRSQQVVPMANPATPDTSGSPSAPQAPPATPPGGFGDLFRPTDRPGEPVTTGMPMGAGSGPEVLSMNQVQTTPLVKGLTILNGLGSSLSPDLKHLVARMSASQAQSSPL